MKVVLHPWEKWERMWDLGVLHRIGWGPKGKSMLLKLIKCSSFLNWAMLFLQEPCCGQNPLFFHPHHTGLLGRHATTVCTKTWSVCKRQRFTLHYQLSRIIYKGLQIFEKLELRSWGEKLRSASPWSWDVVVLYSCFPFSFTQFQHSLFNHDL